MYHPHDGLFFLFAVASRKEACFKGVDGVLRSKDPGKSFNGRPYAVQPLRDTAARDDFFYAL